MFGFGPSTKEPPVPDDEIEIWCDGWELTDAESTHRVVVDRDWWANEGSDRLDELLLGSEMMQPELAEIAGVASETVKAHRSSNITPGVDTLKKYERVFGEGSLGEIHYEVRFKGVRDSG